ncbi:macrolide 2'-phosphotransferase [Arsenicitalea aurantiaca]|uniref:Macrolide 2'-phosphotransferase n=1 Tax=Arsenicitalea aurantiaca TaxID=1783274 RepID=A0A433X8B6_9HYPH|nr:macrolide 2'-phosphotransferase [Arsenicitalea aurantiaca]RUT30337.1 macrolide 2'-phosphotransferase [Arsenicitalea aurantiaca]
MALNETPQTIAALASRHGLDIVPETVRFNSAGLDFLVAFAADRAGADWVLRLPRRPDVVRKGEGEARILGLVGPRLPLSVPDWRVRSETLIAYPLLAGQPGITVDTETMTPTWHFDQGSEAFAESFGRALAALHAIPHEAAREAGLTVLSPEDVRSAMLLDLGRVREGIGIGAPLEARIRAWIDNDALWPEFSVFVHGDLYPAHVLIDAQDRACGIIDWTEAKVSDPAIDLAMHLLGFGPEGLEQLLVHYREAGGRTWPGLADHCAERVAAGPLNYGLFALESGDASHLAAAREQLGVGD